MTPTELYDATCPECDFPFKAEDPTKGEVLACADCGLNFLVTSLDPVQKRVSLELTETNADDWGEQRHRLRCRFRGPG